MARSHLCIRLTVLLLFLPEAIPQYSALFFSCPVGAFISAISLNVCSNKVFCSLICCCILSIHLPSFSIYSVSLYHHYNTIPPHMVCMPGLNILILQVLLSSATYGKFFCIFPYKSQGLPAKVLFYTFSVYNLKIRNNRLINFRYRIHRVFFALALLFAIPSAPDADSGNPYFSI